LMYSNASATSTTIKISVMRNQEFFSTMWLMTLPESRQRSVTFSNKS
jgi:hypothetical protein